MTDSEKLIEEPSGAIYDAFGTVVTRADTAFELGRQAGRSEPQGEPSDAQVEEVKRHMWHEPSRRCSCGARIETLDDQIRHTLRAAGGVR